MTVAEVFFPDMAIMFTHMAGQIPTTFGQEIGITQPIPAAPVAVAEVAVPAPVPVPAEDAPDAVRRTVTEKQLKQAYDANNQYCYEKTLSKTSVCAKGRYPRLDTALIVFQ